MVKAPSKTTTSTTKKKTASTTSKQASKAKEDIAQKATIEEVISSGSFDLTYLKSKLVTGLIEHKKLTYSVIVLVTLAASYIILF